MNAKLRIALANCVRALECHIRDEAKRLGVKPAEVCPCTTDEIENAKKLLLTDPDS